MNEIKNKMKKQAGFTLAELLIVVAIIAVLVAIAIPIFTTQLERSKESTDLANIRSAYAEATTDAITEGSGAASGSYKQGDADWHIDHVLTTRVNGSESQLTLGSASPGGTFTVSVDASGNVTIS